MPFSETRASLEYKFSLSIKQTGCRSLTAPFVNENLTGKASQSFVKSERRSVENLPILKTDLFYQEYIREVKRLRDLDTGWLMEADEKKCKILFKSSLTLLRTAILVKKLFLQEIRCQKVEEHLEKRKQFNLKSCNNHKSNYNTR